MNGIQNLFDYLEATPKGTPAWFVIFDLQGGRVSYQSSAPLVAIHLRVLTDQ
jgi:hypothetical protein